MVEKKEKPSKAKTKAETRKSPKFYSGTGRRKRAVARVWLYPKKGELIVNEKPIEEYFPGEKARFSYVKPFHATGISHPKAHFSATIKVEGSGKSAQLDAVVLGFARALLEYDSKFRPQLRKFGLLTRDSREKERKKYFLRKARKRPQYSKR